MNDFYRSKMIDLFLKRNKPENPFQTMMEQKRLIKLKAINIHKICRHKNEAFGKPDTGQKTGLCNWESLGEAIFRGNH